MRESEEREWKWKWKKSPTFGSWEASTRQRRDSDRSHEGEQQFSCLLCHTHFESASLRSFGASKTCLSPQASLSRLEWPNPHSEWPWNNLAAVSCSTFWRSVHREALSHALRLSSSAERVDFLASFSLQVNGFGLNWSDKCRDTRVALVARFPPDESRFTRELSSWPTSASR